MTQKIYLKTLSISMVLGMGLLTSPIIAEELSPMEITSAKMEKVVQASMPQTVPSQPHDSRIGLRVTPQFGFLGSADGNQYLLNKFTSGVSTELTLSPNVSIEGVFRYARYNVRPDIAVNSTASGWTSNQFIPGQSGQGSITPIGDMRQITVGANLRYELFPHSIMTPFIGGGLAYFDNEFISNGYMRMTLPQHVYGATILSGMKLRLSREVALVGRAEAGQLLNNKNGRIYWGQPYGDGSSLYPNTSFRSYDQYYVITAGVSFGI
ncbi:MAG: hypothetical protein A3B70_04690 [Deltaproteobacteria bacterium RIFCSPHIGHO2_02_FULL_40_11]|nr:MAG: hypothetical protein A3B70_04690 [Deltaproteobacteria bacterium RIFCSPHIGHO2_02_FULL_40_11]